MRKNGFSKFQNHLVSEVRRCIKEGATLQACSVLIGIENEVSETYVQETYTSWIKVELAAI